MDFVLKTHIAETVSVALYHIITSQIRKCRGNTWVSSSDSLTHAVWCHLMHGPLRSWGGTPVWKKPQLASTSPTWDMRCPTQRVFALVATSHMKSIQSIIFIFIFFSGTGQFLDAQEYRWCHQVTCAWGIISPTPHIPSQHWVWAFHKAIKVTLLHYSNIMQQHYNYD